MTTPAHVDAAVSRLCHLTPSSTAADIVQAVQEIITVWRNHDPDRAQAWALTLRAELESLRDTASDLATGPDKAVPTKIAVRYEAMLEVLDASLAGWPAPK